MFFPCGCEIKVRREWKLKKRVLALLIFDPYILYLQSDISLKIPLSLEKYEGIAIMTSASPFEFCGKVFLESCKL